MKELFIATSNSGKIKEFKEMLEPLGYQVLSLKDLQEEIEVEETGTSFEENAILKATTIAKVLNKMVLADDSGLEITALNNEPGIYSARYMGYDTSYKEKNLNLIQRLDGCSDRSARFVCCMALSDPSGNVKTFEGIVEGRIHHEIDGENGFGYDPIFYYPPYQTTMANLTNGQKHAISHRGKALAKVMEYFNEMETSAL